VQLTEQALYAALTRYASNMPAAPADDLPF